MNKTTIAVPIPLVLFRLLSSPRMNINKCILLLTIFCVAGVSAQEVTVDFNQSVYPPLMNKWGYNAFWNDPGTAEDNEANIAGGYNMQVAAGLVELTEQIEGETLQPIFSRSGSQLNASLQTNYQGLRSTLKANNLLQVTQFCGTPIEMFETPKYQEPGGNLFTNMLYDYYLQNDIPGSNNDYKYRWSSTFGGNGNSYPLPNLAGMDEYADAWADYAEMMYAQDKQPQVFAFWQEPTHTIVSKEGVEDDGAASGQIVNLNHYLDFYTRVAPKIKAKNPDFMMAGFQLNDANVSVLKVALENGQQGTWGEWVMEELLRREAADNTEYPLDFFSFQSFTDTATATFIDRMRMGLVNSRFNKTPILINRYKHEFEDESKNTNQFRLNTNEGIVDLLSSVEIFYDTPEISYVLWSNWKNAANNGWLVLDLAEMMGQMQAHRKEISISGSAQDNVKALASGNGEEMTILIWNSTSGNQNFTLNLQNLPTELQGTAEVFTIKNDNPITTEPSFAISGSTVNESISLSAYEVKFIRISGKPESFLLEDATYAKHEVWVERQDNDPTKMPDGVGHYDLQKSTLIVGTNVKSNGAVGLAGVVLRDVPSYSIRAAITDYVVADANTKICLRVDYLDKDNTLKTVYYYDNNYASSGFFTGAISGSKWRSEVNATYVGLPILSYGHVDLDIAAHEPAGWASADNGARRVMISLLLRNAESGSVLSANLQDNFVTSGSVVYLESVSTDLWMRPVTNDTDNAEIELVANTNTGNRTRWEVEKTNDGYFRFLNVRNNRRLRPVSTQLGSLMMVGDVTQTGNNTQWSLVYQGNDRYRLINKNTGFFMKPNSDNTRVEAATNQNNTTMWRLVPLSSGARLALIEETAEDIESNIQVYPTLVNDRLNIEVTNKNYQLEVVDMFGRRMYYSKDSDASIDVSKLKSGMYLLHLFNTEEDERVTYKFIKE